MIGVARFFAPRYFANRYWAKLGAVYVAPEVTSRGRLTVAVVVRPGI